MASHQGSKVVFASRKLDDPTNLTVCVKWIIKDLKEGNQNY